MPNIDFPTSPTALQEVTVGDKTWYWSGTGWRVKTQIVTGPTGPTGPTGSTGAASTVTGPTGPGYINVPLTSQSANYTFVIDDAGCGVLHPSADTTARTFTVPANSSVAFVVGTCLTIVNQNGAGVITIAITTDTMRLSEVGTTGSRTLAANGMATIFKVTSTEWLISGTGLT